MKKLLAVFAVFVICSAANASILNIGFETSEGYPAAYGDSGSNRLERNGWYCTTLGSWYVPYIANSTFAYTGQRSAECTASYIMGTQSASYSSPFTPSAGQTTVVYSAAVAIQKYAYGVPNTTYIYAGIGLTGINADSEEIDLGGLRIMGDGTVKFWGLTSNTSNYSFNRDTWYLLEMRANFANDTVQFYLDGNFLGSLAFNSSIVSLKSISLHNGGTKSSSTGEARYDAISLSIPEPATLLIFGFGVLTLTGKNNKK